MNERINQGQPVTGKNVLTVVNQYIELAGELTNASSVLRSACCAAEAHLASKSAPADSLPYAITRMQQVLTQLDYLSEACHRFVIDLLCGTDYPRPKDIPLFASIPDFKSTKELTTTLESQIQHLCGVLDAAKSWFKSPTALSWIAADLSQAGSIFLDFIAADT